MMVMNHAAHAESSQNNPYFEIPTPFVVNLTGDDAVTFLQVHAQLKVSTAEHKSLLNKHLPGIMHTIMMVLSDQTRNSISGLEGKQKLRTATVKEVQAFMQKETGNPVIEDVLFTSFIVQ